MLKGPFVKATLMLYLFLLLTSFSEIKSSYLLTFLAVLFGIGFIGSRFFCLDCKRFNIKYHTEKIRDGYGGTVLYHERSCKKCEWSQFYKYKDSSGQDLLLFSGWVNNNNRDYMPHSHYN